MIEHGGKSWGAARRVLTVSIVLVLAAALLAVQLASGSPGRAAGARVAGRPASTGATASRAAAAGPRAARHLSAGADRYAAGPASFRPGVVLLAFRAGTTPASRAAAERAVGGWGARRLGPALRSASRAAGGAAGLPTPIELRVSGSVARAVRLLRRLPGVAYAEPNYLMHATAVPNDPSFPLQWADNNTGQAIPTQEANEVLGAPASGTPGADDGALKAWGITTGSAAVVIAETDTGVDYTHPDLAANIWSNPGGIGGCAAGTHGYSVVSHTCNPMDDDTVYGGHGSHVAGIMGAVGNNSTGVAGMNWHTTILPVKWLSSSAWGETSGLIEALQWVAAAKQAGVNVRVVNDSATFTGTAYSQALSDEIDTLGANGILFVTAAGNTGNNNDEEKVRRYPCGYDRATEICVTATDNNDKLPSWANYGPHTVDLAAPGVSIYSTLREGKYGYLSGGSMASPQVAGAAALILSAAPTMSPQELKADIVSNADPLPSLAGKVISGGRLDVCKALPGCSVAGPPPPTTATFGKTSVGASSDTFTSGRKRVNRYALSTAGEVTKLSVYLTPTQTAGQQVMKGVIYADSGGAPSALEATSQQLTFSNTNAAGWYDLTFATPVKLAAGNYWIGVLTGSTGKVAGFRYDSVTSSRAYNTNVYSSGPSNPFGAASFDREQTSLYATYTPTLLPVPVNSSPPQISGTAQQGHTLSETHGAWSNLPTAYSYQWLRCDELGAACAPISGATSQSYNLVAVDVGHTIKVQETASNAGGSGKPASSEATAVVAPAPTPVPTNTTRPAITGTAQQGRTLSVQPGAWANSPTSFAYQWMQCDSTGAGCLPIAGATGTSYVPEAGDVGHTITVQETASNAGGSGEPASSAPTAKVLPAVPTNSSPPSISGTAQQGQTLTADPGTWTNEPTSFTYQWQRCDSAGANCVAISSATASSYTVAPADAGSTLRVAVTAHNSGGASSPSSSAQTALVPAGPATFGKVTVGASSDTFLADRKRVNRYALAAAGTLTKLSIYLAHTTTSGQQVLKGLIYSDSSGSPGTLLGVSEQVAFTSTSATGWYDLPFATPVSLAAGNYWIGIITGATSGVAGFRYDSVSGSRAYNANLYTSGPSSPFGSFTSDSEQTSLYATYTPS
jgi:thermitase